MRRLDELRLALMLLTRLPMGRLKDPAPSIAAALWAFPFAGLVVGTLAWLGARALDFDPIAAAWGLLIASALLTGGLHHDGLADVADGFGGGQDKARRLEIMRDSRVGSYGVLALVLALGLGAAALARLEPSLIEVLSVACLSRLAMATLATLLPPARQDGLGQSARAKPKALLPGLLLCLALTALSGAWPLWLGIGAVAFGLGWCAHRLIGGQTGDVLGATQLLSEVAGWVILAAFVT